MKRLNYLFTLMACGAVMFLASCGDDEAPADNAVVIAGIPAAATIENLGTLGPVTVTLTAADGLASFSATKDGVAVPSLAKTYTGETTATFDFSYDATSDDSGRALEFIFTATDADGDSDTFTHTLTLTYPSIDVTANITSDTEWKSDFIYFLNARIIVEPGSELTIEAGTVIKGRAGQEAAATALIVAKGAKIFANGTAAEPIIFTTEDDALLPGQIASPNLDETERGKWGGLIVLGDAPVSDGGNDGTEQIEGIPGDVSLAEYGGSTMDDNSGSLTYVSIRHGGTKLGDGSEINGLTLGGVGSGTIINHIEVVANFDDGIEFFGGTVDASNLLVWAADDDALDIDQAYSGTINNAVVIALGTDHALEIDGPEGNLDGGFTMTNVSIKGDDQELADFRDGAQGDLSNLYFFGFSEDPKTQIDDPDNPGTMIDKGEGDFSLSGDDSKANYASGSLAFATIQITKADGVALADIFKNFTTEQIGSTVSEVATGANTVGADASVFSWTFADEAGALSDF